MGKSLKGMTLGVATSAFQIEGGWDADGKGESIWDRWCHIPGRTKAPGDVATDFYHRWKEDIDLMHELGVDSFRFSISWPRVLPDGHGRVNEAGLQFYKNIVARLKMYGIKAAVTLYHWDLPQKLQNIGGWANPLTAVYFKEFAELMFKELGDDVDVWITHNEPFVATFVGHFSGSMAPGHRDLSETLLVAHNLLLSHGMAVKAFREGGYRGKIGISLDYFPAKALTDSIEDIKAAERDRDSHLGWFADPIYKGHYPVELWEHYKKKGVVMPEIADGDMELISQPIDFLGINFYRSSNMKYQPGGNWPYDNAYAPIECEKTHINYKHMPERLLEYLTYLNDTYNPGEIMITENGYSNQENVNRNGKVMDFDRINYLYLHIEQCAIARERGIPLSSYYIWSFTDDLEWGGGYTTRMGIVRIDYETLERIPKESAYWYKRVIEARELVD